MSVTPRTPHRALRRTFIAAGVAAGAVAASAVVVATSSAAFTATTNNTGDTWTAATLALTDDDSTSAMFNVAGMVPGQTETRCIEVTYNGTASSLNPIKLYSALDANTLDLANYLNLQVEQGSGGAFGDCSTFTADSTIISGETLAFTTANHTDYATGVGTFTPATSPASVSYRFTVTLDAATPNTSQGGNAAATFTWEIQTA